MLISKQQTKKNQQDKTYVPMWSYLNLEFQPKIKR